MTASLAGYMDDSVGLDTFGALVDLLIEQVPELQHPQSVWVYARMQHEPQLGAVLRAYRLAMRRANWAVNGAGCRDEVTARVADDLGLPVAGLDEEPTGARRRKFTWAEHLRVASSLKLVYGHAPFAQQWDEQAGGWRLGMVQERMPHTIAGLKLNPDGTLKGAYQGGLLGQPSNMLITTADHQLVWYAHERLGSNYYGQSLLRDCYGPWLIKNEMLRVHATSIKRFGMGVPQVNAPAGAVPTQVAEAERLARTYKAGNTAGVGLPAGFSMELKGMTGSVPDALAFVTYLDRLMTRTTLTSILDMAVAERGNRSLGETVMDLMVYAQQAEADDLAGEATTQIVVPLVDANWSEDEPAPVIECTGVGADVELTAQDLNWLLEYGGIRPDTPARAWIRERYGLPDEDPNDPVFQQPDPSTPPPGGTP